jgi:hypothetical protein
MKKDRRGSVLAAASDSFQFYAERSFVSPAPVLTSRRRRPRGSTTRPEEHTPMSSVRSFCVFEVGSFSTHRSNRACCFPLRKSYPCNGVSATRERGKIEQAGPVAVTFVRSRGNKQQIRRAEKIRAAQCGDVCVWCALPLPVPSGSKELACGAEIRW